MNKGSEGQLILVGTPIGNLKDITLRALEVFEKETVFFCEDTRITKNLFRALGISIQGKAFIRFDAYREREATETVLKYLKEGRTCVLVSDAGMPVIQDPGCRLVAHVWTAGFRVTVLPGPSALTAGLALSGLPGVPFHFWGYLPRKDKAFRELISRWKMLTGTHVGFESGKRLTKTLERFCELLGKTSLCLIKELTKQHENRFYDTPWALLDFFRREPQALKGEWVVLWWNPSMGTHVCVQDFSIVRRVYEILKKELGSTRKAVRILSQLTSVPSNELYKELHTRVDEKNSE